MQVQLISASELTDDLVRTWLHLQREDPALDSPFFCPQFTQTAAAVRNDVEVALMAEGNQVRGFFPFQRGAAGRGQPVGAPFSEFHGVVACCKLKWTPAELLAKCGLRCWAYDHLPTSLPQFAQYHRRVGDSPCIDLSAGFEAYCETKRRAGSAVISQAGRKARKLARDLGPLRFELHCSDEAVLEKLLMWKSLQHQRTGVLDVFRFDWVKRFLRKVRDTRNDDFSGMMSVLFAGNDAVAVHLGLRNRAVAHVWYPAYDPRWAKYSPGMSLFVELARELANQGVQRIDLGPGPQRYKRSLQTGAVQVAIGTVDRWPAARWARRRWTNARGWFEQLPLRDQVQAPAKMLFRARQWLALRIGDQGRDLGQGPGIRAEIRDQGLGIREKAFESNASDIFG